MARPYYNYTEKTNCRRSLLSKLRKFVVKFVVRVWTDDLFCITFFKSLFFHLGLWPVDDHPSKRGYWLRYWNPRLALATLAFLYFVSIPVATYNARNGELILFLEPIAFSFMVGMLALEFYCLVDNSAEFAAALRSLQAVRECSAILKHRPKALLKRARQLSLLVLLYFGVCIWNVTLFSGGLPFVLLPKRKFPTRVWYPYDGTASPFYEVTLVGWACIIFSGGTVLSLVNSFLMACLVQAIGQLDILNYNIRQIGPSPAKRANRGVRRARRIAASKLRGQRLGKRLGLPMHHQQVVAMVTGSQQARDGKEWLEALKTDYDMAMTLRNCVRHHQAIVRFVRSVNLVFWPIIVAQFVNSVVPTFIAIILVTQSAALDMRIVMFITLIVMCNMTLGIFSRLANEITVQSALVKDSVMDCDWFDASRGFKNSMRLMILMSGQPLVFHVAGSIHMSMESFLAVTKLTYSYYMTAMATVRRQLVADKISIMAMPDML